MSLTPKQKKFLDFIQSYSGKKGYAPSQQEIAKHFGFSSLGTVQNYLVRLERQGLLQKAWNARRGTELLHTTPPPSSNMVPLPLLGRVAAGRPIEAVSTPETLDVPASLLKKTGEHFVLRIVGDSMIEDGILNGDFVVVRKQPNANNGQTVVALVGNEATIKRYYKKPGQIELHPANPNYEPILINSMVEANRGFKIEGIMVGLIRRVE